MDKQKEIQRLGSEIESQILSQLDVQQKEIVKPNPIEKGWLQIQDKKWEYYENYIPIGTIYLKTTGQYSLWFKSPVILKQQGVSTFQTHRYSTLQEAQHMFFKHLEKEALEWCKAVVSSLNNV